jgi:hypothetical protein
MANLDDLRRIVLALPETTESTHFGMPSFRVDGRGFAGVSKDGARVLLHLPAPDAAAAIAEAPASRQELRRGATLLGLDADLSAVPVGELEVLVEAAWRHRAPKRILDR